MFGKKRKPYQIKIGILDSATDKFVISVNSDLIYSNRRDIGFYSTMYAYTCVTFDTRQQVIDYCDNKYGNDNYEIVKG